MRQTIGLVRSAGKPPASLCSAQCAGCQFLAWDQQSTAVHNMLHCNTSPRDPASLYVVLTRPAPLPARPLEGVMALPPPPAPPSSWRASASRCCGTSGPKAGIHCEREGMAARSCWPAGLPTSIATVQVITETVVLLLHAPCGSCPAAPHARARPQPPLRQGCAPAPQSPAYQWPVKHAASDFIKRAGIAPTGLLGLMLRLMCGHSAAHNLHSMRRTRLNKHPASSKLVSKHHSCRGQLVCFPQGAGRLTKIPKQRTHHSFTVRFPAAPLTASRSLSTFQGVTRSGKDRRAAK